MASVDKQGHGWQAAGVLHRDSSRVPWRQKFNLSLSFPFQESAAAMKAMPLTQCIDICVCAVIGDTVKGEWGENLPNFR